MDYKPPGKGSTMSGFALQDSAQLAIIITLLSDARQQAAL
jgi:hypothetical protein